MECQSQNDRHYGKQDEDTSNEFHPPWLKKAKLGYAKSAVLGILLEVFLLVLHEGHSLSVCAMGLGLGLGLGPVGATVLCKERPAIIVDVGLA
jgi:hypothetical protein